MTQENAVPIRLGDFQILDQIGAGGMGIVYKALQMSVNRVVALKVLGQALRRPNDIARFQREASATAKLDHPNIATIYYVGQDDKICYMAMKYIEGVPLRTVIDRLARTTSAESTFDSAARQTDENDKGKEVRFDLPTTPVDVTPILEQDDEDPLTSQAKQLLAQPSHIERCCQAVKEAALALDYAHQQGVIHRDVKPENLMVDEEGKVHLIDFGIARFLEDATLTETGQLIGTPMYMSPEQVAGRIEIDHRTDIYSLGMVLYELLTLVPVISASNRESVLRNIITKNQPPISWKNTAVPTPLENVIHKAISKDPDERYPSAAEFAEDVDRFLSKKPVLAGVYRYPFDRSELIAERPAGVVLTAMLSGALAIITILYSTAVLSSIVSRIMVGEVQIYWDFDGPFRVGLLVFWAVGFTVWSFGLMRGSMACHLFFYSALIPSEGWLVWKNFNNWIVEGDIDSTVYYFLIVPILFSLPFHKRSREWFAKASRLRKEHKRRQEG